jgi:hypothetical protein
MYSYNVLKVVAVDDDEESLPLRKRNPDLLSKSGRGHKVFFGMGGASYGTDST